MRASEEIDAEIAKLRALLDAKNENNQPRYNRDSRQIISAQITALSGRFTEEQVERAHYYDETAEDYKDGDNNIYHLALNAVKWMRCQQFCTAPSKNL